MPPLSKNNAPKLLRQVNNKQHASDDDHEDKPPYPTPASSNTSFAFPKRMDSNDDLTRSPISSDDDEFVKLQARVPEAGLQESPVNFKHLNIDGCNDNQQPAPAAFKPARSSRSSKATELPEATFQRPSVPSPTSANGKREAESEHPSSDTDPGWMSSQASNKRQKKSTDSRVTNIHAAPARKSKALYGSRVSKQATKREETKKKEGLKKSKAAAVAQKVGVPEFKQPKAYGQLPMDDATRPDFQQPRTSGDFALTCDGDSDFSISSLSSPPSSPGVEEVTSLGLPAPQPYLPQTECAICGETVDKFLREDFEDQYHQGKALSYKWQKRFCDHHRRHSAGLKWKERGYPEIEWASFRERLRRRKHISHVKNVIVGEVDSVFRKRFDENVRSNGKTLAQAAGSWDEKKGASVGYYGPRGEKLMTDHILTDFADQLRDHATKDRLVAAAGVSGGVSGFVQAVLVPELAVSLIQEDLGSGKALNPVDVIAESAELGELLHPDVEDKVRTAVEEDSDG